MSSNFGISLPKPNIESSVADSYGEATISLPKQQDEDTTRPMFGGGTLTPESGALSRAVVSNLHLLNMQPQQHSMLFYFSLIEGRCKTQAATTLNVGRRPDDHLPESHPQIGELAQHLFAEMTKELHDAGVLPIEFAGQNFASLRQNYLSSFDNILNNIASKRHNEILANNAHRAIEDTGVLFTNNYTVSSFDYSTSSPFADDQSRAVQPLAMSMAHRSDQRHTRGRGSTLSGFILGSSPVQPGLVTSPFHENYRLISQLGKGGFGCVYRVLDLTDNREYALKKITVSAARLRLMQIGDIKDALLREVRGLAKLEHRNVVRYFAGWIEWRPAHKPSTSKQLLPGEESSSSSEESTDSEDFDGEDIQSEIRRRLEKEAGHSLSDASGNEEYDDSILFEHSTSCPPSIENFPQKPSSSGNSQSMFRKPSESGLSDWEESTEEITRALKRAEISDEYPDINEDANIYIKMSVLPMTLEDYLWPDKSDQSKPDIQHCFHSCASARILLALLDGVEYIHSQKIVHRDLKPSNIFLSVRDGLPSVYDGSVDVTSCSECEGDVKRPRCNIIPHIGDFGLIAEINDTPGLNIPSSSALSALFKPSPLAVLSSRQPGTKFYCPPSINSSKSVICPKLDVFALGVIAFELIMYFSTKSERADVLGKLLRGEFPERFEEHVMFEGVKGMLALEREERWDCERVRVWLGDVVGMYGKSGVQ